LPDSWKSLFLGWNIRVINDSVFTLLGKFDNTCLFIPTDALVNISEYERLLILEDQIRLKNLVIPISETTGALDQQALRNRWLDLTDQWSDITIGYRKDERHQYIRNLVAGVTLRKKIADMHGKRRACDIRTTVLINSLLFGGSESYGLVVSEKLRDLGFDLIIAGPVKDVYGSGTKKINEWLEEHHFPPLVQIDYGTAAYQLFSQIPDENEAIHSSKELEKWFEKETIDIIFCSGFIAEPAIADSSHRIVYMALFPPWGYNLANMTFLKNRISGLFSDTRWGLDFWTSWFPTPSEVTPSLVDREYFQILNNDLPKKPVSLAVMGTIIHTKRQREAMLALRQLIMEGYDLQLNIYGHLLDVYKSYIDELMELSKDPLLISRVKFHDFVADPHQVARENHIILSTSIAEGLPQALILNQASGLLPVACPAGGIPEVVIEGETGFLADGFEVEQIVIALRRALHKQDDWAKLEQILGNQTAHASLQITALTGK
jgi:glycosyltransferase involved in cell wall biosynthesis